MTDILGEQCKIDLAVFHIVLMMEMDIEKEVMFSCFTL